MVLGQTTFDNDTDEFGRFLSYHGIRALRVTEEGKPDLLGAKVPLVCRHLFHDAETGLCSCLIYEDRPQICKEHLCEFAKKEAV